MSTAPTDPQGMSDAELIASVRAGQLECYGTLYERHVSAAYNLARQLARTSMEADDLVSDAFSKVLDTLRGGKGPDSAFRAYLLTAVRHGAYDKTRRDKKLDLAEDMTTVTTVGGAGAEALTVEFSDTALEGLERTLAAKAFAKLPERWQAVLWHTEIEGATPAEVAPLLGLTANSVSALAYRAREGLRQAYLQVHLAEVSASTCHATADKLGAWTRDGLSKRERAQVEAHLDDCSDCQALAAELADVNGALRAVIAPLVLGGGVLGYLAVAGGGKAAAATAIGAGTAAGSAGAAAGAGGSGGAAGAAAGAPREFVGVAGSGVAMAAAVALALTAGGGGQQIPTAAEQPQQQPPAAQAPNEPADPPPGQSAPDNPPAQNEPAPQQPPPAPDVTQPESPEPASVGATVAQDDVELVAGGGPADLPITVRNNGGTLSDPIDVTLNLPRGVSALGGGGGGTTAGAAGAPRSTDQSSPATAPQGGGASPSGGALRQAGGGERITCPGGSGTVTCSTGRGLRPGESMTLVFRLQASADAESGQVTGHLSGGGAVNVSLQVPVRVEPKPTPPPPPAEDGVRVQANGFGTTASVEIRNTGDTTDNVTLTSDRPAAGVGRGMDCTDRWAEPLSCTSTDALKPGEDRTVYVTVYDRSGPGNGNGQGNGNGNGNGGGEGNGFGRGNGDDVTFTATLGDAADSATVSFPDCWPPSFLCLGGASTEAPGGSGSAEATTPPPASGSASVTEPPTGSGSATAPPGSRPSGSATATHPTSDPASGSATATTEPESTDLPAPPSDPWPGPPGHGNGRDHGDKHDDDKDRDKGARHRDPQ
ncbi:MULTISPECIES: sigma-70 family RNA polymerase sigma factor [Prauserella salsuginis group]|uniref:Sigma-70 family RNA polymerase sigma factor n=1 Tax=Prauserella salsuginis TaxID=387889 RepID=A0ABW6G6P7_9PSEU|nr:MULTISPECIES: sigma-70 family RNA polymerase sigma factor [Prauserella salsuginis group]MCR3722701.1 RNA polymerase sigma factor, sigma-70 family [Prauserella flava]MCR3737244.1 RNA polymerase sigma factor, sigma-70 family [Prauserella salsuginis]